MTASNSAEDKIVGIVGGGYVGLTTAVCLAELGFPVRILDVDERKVASLRAGEAPIYEPGLEELLQKHLSAGMITATMDVTEAMPVADYVFLCVPTPAAPDGSADTRYLEAASKDIGPHLKSGAIVINKSTVPVGSFQVVGQRIGRDDIDVASNPEFLREGTAISDFMNPDRVVIGSDDPEVGARVAYLYEKLNAETVLTDPASAEIIKYASNAYLATRLTFINSIAEVCEALGGDVEQVARGIGLDSRIGPSFLHPGPGWGGSCFPKDTRALTAMAKRSGFDFAFMRGVVHANERHMKRIAAKCLAMLDGMPSESTIGVLGLAFKAGTDDVRSSPAVEVVKDLVEEGVTVQAYDPKAKVEIDGLVVCDDPYKVAAGADLVVILTEWPEFGELDPAVLAEEMKTAALFDTRDIVSVADFEAKGFTVRLLGRPSIGELGSLV